MKRLFIFLAAAGLLGCTQSSPIAWKEVTFKMDTTKSINRIDVSYLVAEGRPGTDSVNLFTTDLIRNAFGIDQGEYANMTLQQAIDSVLQRKNRDTIFRHMPYELTSQETVRPCGGIDLLELNLYSFTGGAHGQQTTHLANVDRQNGRILTLPELFTDTLKLVQLNRECFSKYCQKAELTSPYLFVTADELPLPQNVGVEKEGITMIYNPYEIAASVVGIIRYTIPYDQAEPILQKIARR